MLDIEAEIAPPGEGKDSAFSPMEIVPTMVEFRFYGDDGRPAAQNQVLLDGAFDEAPHVDGASASNQAALLHATNVPVAFCPTEMEVWGHALHHTGWLMRFAAPARLDAVEPPSGDRPLAIRLKRVGILKLAVSLQPPHHPQDEPPPEPPPRIPAPLRQCQCVSVPGARSSSQEKNVGSQIINTCSTGDRRAGGTIYSTAAVPAGHGGAVDNCLDLGFRFSADFAVSYRLRRDARCEDSSSC